MKFAIPTTEGRLCEHFGQCEKFAIIETKGSTVISESFVSPPEHHERVYPGFLAQLKVDVIISGGIGQKAIDAFNEKNIKVFAGVNSDSPVKLVVNYLNNQLAGGMNLCDH
ncbi:MAG: ATPase [Bacteroidetes bacterium]|nr:MAG: ATPase [Bacteroidota bacterium]